MLKIAHRGASGYALENSFAAFDKAVELGVDSIECDVRMTKDKKLVLMHDNRIERATKGRGKISKMTLAELKQVEMNNGQKIPTLEEFIEKYKGKVKLLMLDVKSISAAPRLVEIINKYKIHSEVLVASFKHPFLIDILIRDSAIQTGIAFNAYRYLKYLFIKKLFVLPAKLVGANIVDIYYKFVDQKVVDRAHKYYLKIYVYSPNKQADIDRMKSYGVDAIISDYPDRI
ncbi:MAG: glycerophosphodiester phosphodiesterase family protein [Patescibacteria group bacterium]